MRKSAPSKFTTTTIVKDPTGYNNDIKFTWDYVDRFPTQEEQMDTINWALNERMYTQLEATGLKIKK